MNGQLVSLLVLQVVAAGGELWAIYCLVVALKKIPGIRWVPALSLVGLMVFYVVIPVLVLLCLVMKWWNP